MAKYPTAWSKQTRMQHRSTQLGNTHKEFHYFKVHMYSLHYEIKDYEAIKIIFILLIIVSSGYFGWYG